ncbi:hypothetical protein TNCV_4859511 [Trichonephila clavipes]|nr:hypothetical protein TNCV_4859511 [Trichonephila clavipes]
MASGSDMTPIYSRSQSEVQGDLHKLYARIFSRMVLRRRTENEEVQNFPCLQKSPSPRMMNNAMFCCFRPIINGCVNHRQKKKRVPILKSSFYSNKTVF